MIEVSNGVVYLTRGDDAILRAEIRSGEETYELQEGDALVMTVREKPDRDSAVILRVTSYTNDLPIPSSCTIGAAVGRYSMDICLLLHDGRRATVFPTLMGSAHGRVRNWKNFVIDPEVNG